MSKRRISLILGLGVILAMGTTACGKHLPAKSESEAINIQVVTREAAAETMAEDPSAAGITEEETSAAEEETTMEVVVAEIDDAEDPQADAVGGGAVNVAEVVQEVQREESQIQETGAGANTNSGSQSAQLQTSNGIDVAKYQGKIDWQKVKASGIDFAMIRVGYRTQKTGEIFEDPYARYNLQEAQKAGIKLGAYFFSTAITEEEARQEAVWVSQILAKYPITYPVAYNCEGFKDSENRQYGLSKADRTALAVTFLDYIKEQGYDPMFYAAKNELTGSADWDTAQLSGKYPIWVSQYPDVPYPQTARSDYSGSHTMWQYTSRGTVDGIAKSVDMNVAYFRLDQENQAKDSEAPEQIAGGPELGITFQEVQETVTAKIATNLRTEPGVKDDSTIVAQLKHGDTATRTGIGDNGWSRVIYQGQTLYALTSYLTTDLNAPEQTEGSRKETMAESNSTKAENQAPAGQLTETIGPDAAASNEETKEWDFSKVVFTECQEEVTAKIETNLRTEPSTRSDDTVAAKLIHGETVVRTGIGSNGWSRVEYNGQTLYAVSSYLMIPEE